MASPSTVGSVTRQTSARLSSFIPVLYGLPIRTPPVVKKSLSACQTVFRSPKILVRGYGIFLTKLNKEQSFVASYRKPGREPVTPTWWRSTSNPRRHRYAARSERVELSTGRTLDMRWEWCCCPRLHWTQQGGDRT